jgi:hypothetical protein
VGEEDPEGIFKHLHKARLAASVHFAE